MSKQNRSICDARRKAKHADNGRDISSTLINREAVGYTIPTEFGGKWCSALLASQLLSIVRYFVPSRERALPTLTHQWR